MKDMHIHKFWYSPFQQNYGSLATQTLQFLTQHFL